ncbi:MAG: T9SS type A sorting domain-containing protein [Flavobacteriales bacterium]
MLVMKVTMDGDIEWNHYFAPTEDLDFARRRSWGYDLVETNKNGQLGYRLVGFGQYNDELNQANNRRRPYMVQLNSVGEKLWDHIELEQGTAWSATATEWLEYGAIDRAVDPVNNDELFVITGRNPSLGSFITFAQYFREPSSAPGFVPASWTREIQSEPASNYPGIDPDLRIICTDVIFHEVAGTPFVVWPLIANAEASMADGFLYMLDPDNDGQTVATASIGEIHAFDLQIGLVSMSNGNIGLCSTKWPAGYATNGDRYGWTDFSEDRRSCLGQFAATSGWDPSSNPGIQNYYNFYGSQSYAAELNGNDLTLIWEKQWQHRLDPNGGDDCYPGNARRRQCNFKIVEADDGGLVICGNTGHNFDDAYLAKLAPCEQVFAYTPLALDANGEHHITTNTEWTEDMNIAGSIVVDPGKILTVNTATIGFAASTPQLKTNIVVQPGATLILKNNAHLTSAPECSGQGMWDGVKVLSYHDPEGPEFQTYPGQVLLRSGGRISNALTGILAGEGDPADPGFANTTENTYGGVVDSRDGVFMNNRIDVVAKEWVSPMGNTPSDYTSEACAARDRFIGTRFVTTAPLKDPSLHPVTHLRGAEVELEVYGCSFGNELGSHSESQRMGHGIESLNADLKVGPCNSGFCPPDTDRPNTFRNLDHAVHATHSMGTGYPNIQGNTFTDNICAVYLADMPAANVSNNTVTMGRWDVDMSENLDEFYWNGAHRAIFTTGSSGLQIMDNTLGRTAGTTTLLEGIVVGYTQEGNEVVFRNSATDLDIAYVGEGVCADVENDPSLLGLQFQCNTNTNNATNFKSRIAAGSSEQEHGRQTIRGRQGTPTIGASNSFGGAQHFEVGTRCDALEYVEYSYGSGQAPATYTVQDLGDLDADYLEPVLVSSTITCPTGTPVYVVGGGGNFTEVRPHLIGSKYAYGNLRYQLDQLIDGGSTDEVVLEIVSAWPQEYLDLRNELMAKSPYLSVEALRSLVDKPDVPVAIKAEVIIANPDASKKNGFLKWAEWEAEYPIPGYLADAVEASWDSKTYRTTLEENLADAHTKLTQTAYYAIGLLRADSTAHPDSLRWAWQQVRTNGARYAEASLLMEQGDFATARAMVDAIPVEKEQKEKEEAERVRMLACIDVLANAHADGRDVYHLTPNEVSALDNAIGTHYDRAANNASNLLCAVYDKCRAPYTGDASVPKNNRTRQRTRDTTSPTAANFGLYPNPTRNWVVLTADEGSTNILLQDPSGRTVATATMNGNSQQTMDLKGLAPGSYMVHYQNEGRTVHTERLVIQ